MIYEAFDFVGSMNTPMAMIVAGSIISQIHPGNLISIKRLYYIAFVKLLLIPLCYTVFIRMFPVEDMVKVIAVMLTACPTAAFGIIFAVKYHRDEEYAVELFTVTTLLSLITIPFCMIFIL